MPVGSSRTVRNTTRCVVVYNVNTSNCKAEPSTSDITIRASLIRRIELRNSLYAPLGWSVIIYYSGTSIQIPRKSETLARQLNDELTSFLFGSDVEGYVITQRYEIK